MKTAKPNVPLLLVFSMSFIVACGNPHLIVNDVSDDGVVNTTNLQPQIIQESLLIKNRVNVKDSSGNTNLNFNKISLKAVNNKTLVITSLTDSALPLRYYIENGESFVFTDGAAPGKNGTCAEVLRAREVCEVDIKFIATKVGVYEDSLIITNDDDIKISIPIFGERIEDLEDSKSGKVTYSNPLEMALDYGSISKGSTSIKTIEINNTSNKDVIVESYNISDSAFSVSSKSSCGQVLRPGKCIIEISFNPKDERDFSAILNIKEDKEHFLEVKLVGKSYTATQCLVSSEQILEASPVSLGEYDISTFPYLSKSNKTKSKLATLYGTEFNTYVPGASLKTVKDAQVITSYIVGSQISNVMDLIIEIDGYKVISDDYKDTEMICLSTAKFKKCSGHKFTLKDWLLLNNTSFWKTDLIPMNDKFEKLLAKNEIKCGKSMCQFVKAKMSFKELFNLTDAELQIVGKEKIINIIVADDTRLLNLPKLKILTATQKECK